MRQQQNRLVATCVASLAHVRRPMPSRLAVLLGAHSITSKKKGAHSIVHVVRRMAQPLSASCGRSCSTYPFPYLAIAHRLAASSRHHGRPLAASSCPVVAHGVAIVSHGSNVASSWSAACSTCQPRLQSRQLAVKASQLTGSNKKSPPYNVEALSCIPGSRPSKQQTSSISAKMVGCNSVSCQSQPKKLVRGSYHRNLPGCSFNSRPSQQESSLVPTTWFAGCSFNSRRSQQNWFGVPSKTGLAFLALWLASCSFDNCRS